MQTSNHLGGLVPEASVGASIVSVASTVVQPPRPAAAGAGAIDAIRRQTSTAHRHLEVDLGLMSASLTLTRYRSLLLGLAAVHRGLQREIAGQLSGSAGALRTELDLVARDRMPSIGRDLLALGEAFPIATTLRLTSVPGALGALYVCEGSRLGADRIARHVRSVLGEATPVEFFTSGADEVVEMWSTCCRVIDRVLLTPPAITEASAVAVSVFGHFADVLR